MISPRMVATVLVYRKMVVAGMNLRKSPIRTHAKMTNLLNCAQACLVVFKLLRLELHLHPNTFLRAPWKNQHSELIDVSQRRDHCLSNTKVSGLCGGPDLWCPCLNISAGRPGRPVDASREPNS